jgi:sialate O-acetylesterase
MNNFRNLFVLVFLLSPFVLQAQYGEKLDRFEKTIEEYRQLDQQDPPQKGGIVFTGSSSVRMWKNLIQDLSPLPVLNRGFGGSTLPEVLHYAEEVILKYQPRIVAVYAGDNDVAMKATPNQILENFKDLVSKVKYELPDVLIYFIAIKPSVSRWEMWPVMQEANQMVQDYARRTSGVKYFDVSSPMIENGKVMTDIFLKDNLHMNDKGYSIWTSVIKPELNEALDSLNRLRMPRIFSSHMVLQRDKSIPLWGKGKPGERITVELGGNRQNVRIDQTGNWRLDLPPLPAGGPHQLEISGYQNLSYEDVLMGDVWLASGQSNMQWSLEWEVDNYEEEIAAADHPNLRLFTVPREVAYTPQTDISGGEWMRSSPENVGSFSAVAYFFGRDLLKELNVPIGIIHSSWGGTPAEAWTSGEMLTTLPDFRSAVLERQSDPEYIQHLIPDNQRKQKLQDSVRTHAAEGVKQKVHQLKYEDSQWENINLPNDLSETEYKNYDGFLWYRKQVELPADFAKQPLTVSIGQMVHEGDVYFNGTKIGEGDNSQKVYNFDVPAKLVRKGANLVAVRVMNRWGNGGLTGPAESMFIRKKGDVDGSGIDLAGNWKISTKIEPEYPAVIGFQNQPATLYNAMIAPLVPYGLTGFIWYQGESNAGRAYQYRSLFPAMIEDWRVRFRQGYLPFLYVQLANFMQRQNEPADDAWAELREAQAMTLAYPRTGMAVAIDIGDSMDIHPRNKQDVGKRLALAARKIAYGEDVAFSGPVYASDEVNGGKFLIRFDHTGKGLKTSDGNSPVGFTIAGEDQKFHFARARIVDENTVEVWSEKVKDPVAVRYAWESNPPVNLYNEAGLPAVPFRTDQWKGITQP